MGPVSVLLVAPAGLLPTDQVFSRPQPLLLLSFITARSRVAPLVGDWVASETHSVDLSPCL